MMLAVCVGVSVGGEIRRSIAKVFKSCARFVEACCFYDVQWTFDMDYVKSVKGIPSSQLEVAGENLAHASGQESVAGRWRRLLVVLIIVGLLIAVGQSYFLVNEVLHNFELKRQIKELTLQAEFPTLL